jgi:hypothetical protein
MVGSSRGVATLCETWSIVALLDDAALMFVEWMSLTETSYVILLLGELVLMIESPLNSGKLSKKGGYDSVWASRSELQRGRKSRFETGGFAW